MRVLRTLILLCLAMPFSGSASAQDRRETNEARQSRQSQDIVELYRIRRMNSRAAIQSFFRMDAMPPVSPNPDYKSVVPSRGEVADPQPADPGVAVYHVRRVPRFARKWFEEQFAGVDWAYDGGNTLAPLDTMFTRETRARMEHVFGAPTRTLADHGPIHRLELDEYIQFEYWFLINGEWPIIIMDVNGPFERGVVVSGQAKHREQLIAIRDAVLAPILKSDVKAPYADYFFETELREWYVTGFDGKAYFLRPVQARSVNPGRPTPPEPKTNPESGTD